MFQISRLTQCGEPPKSEDILSAEANDAGRMPALLALTDQPKTPSLLKKLTISSIFGTIVSISILIRVLFQQIWFVCDFTAPQYSIPFLLIVVSVTEERQIEKTQCRDILDGWAPR
jgi:hypothetical protein